MCGNLTHCRGPVIVQPQAAQDPPHRRGPDNFAKDKAHVTTGLNPPQSIPVQISFSNQLLNSKQEQPYRRMRRANILLWLVGCVHEPSSQPQRCQLQNSHSCDPSTSLVPQSRWTASLAWARSRALGWPPPPNSPSL